MWNLPIDMKFFKNTTWGFPVIMGRKTFESIGRALPNRRNIVISRNPEWQHAGVESVSSLAAAQALVVQEHAYIIGGAEIYQQALGLADQLIITEIEQEFACDAFFPEIAPQVWQEVKREPQHSETNQFNYAFVTYKRR